MSHHRNLLLASLSDQVLRDDFSGMGVPTESIETLMGIVEPVVDRLGCPTRRKEEKVAFEKKINKPGGRKERRAAAAAPAVDVPGHQIFPVPGNKNWILFNPALKSLLPLHIPPLKPDSLFRRYAIYEPGNKKILVYNLVSGALGLRCTPERWRGAGVEVEYQEEEVRIKVLNK